MNNELLMRQLIRQLKIMNFWISVYGALILVVLAAMGYMVFKVVTFVNDTNKKIDNLTTQTKETLDFKSKVCNSDSIGELLTNRTEVCRQ
jgi:hypothetical protein